MHGYLCHKRYVFISFRPWRLLCLLVREYSCSTACGVLILDWNLKSISCVLMLNKIVSAHISMWALALLNNGHPRISGISRSPSASRIMKFVKTSCMRIHTGIWYNFPLGWQMVESANCTWISIEVMSRANLSSCRWLWPQCGHYLPNHRELLWHEYSEFCSQ